ncbi:MAG TPA: response regulator [Pirellulaceae bacterium]|jgi:CheY-like chemotaxis protein|nr:response regulator [Pirellulaceae bacterium]
MRKKVVLICDRDRATVRSLAEEFQLVGLNVETAFDLESAVAQMDQRLPDLLCVDLELSSPEGLSVFQMLSTDQLAARLPGIALIRRMDDSVALRTADMCVYPVLREANAKRWVECLTEELLGAVRRDVARRTADDDGFEASCG